MTPGLTLPDPILTLTLFDVTCECLTLLRDESPTAILQTLQNPRTAYQYQYPESYSYHIIKSSYNQIISDQNHGRTNPVTYCNSVPVFAKMGLVQCSKNKSNNMVASGFDSLASTSVRKCAGLNLQVVLARVTALLSQVCLLAVDQDVPQRGCPSDHLLLREDLPAMSPG